MASDSDLVARLREILRDSDLDKATAGSVRRQLEEDFGVDLSDRKAFIREQIDIYLQNLGGAEDADGDDGNVKAEDEEADAAEVEVGEEAEDEENEEDEEENEGKGSRKRRKKSGKEIKRRGGFNKLCSLSQQLQSFVGVPTLARTEVVKKTWSYIREKNLQDPKDKRKIICDEVLRGLFRVNSINMFQMNKALARHIMPLNPEDETVHPKVENEDTDSPSAEEANSSAKELEEEEGEEDEERVEEEMNGRGRKKRRL
ncbi:hypothetical protein CRG98_040340 [Punica granatum]|uniref:Uncharacterized protein n=1 Tax=Punica granatum TaxID=22663 RepID=A0A2I0I5K5_PUNGR|nr:hypothetical protein CRG98_040340 [Punica granatum]